MSCRIAQSTWSEADPIFDSDNWMETHAYFSTYWQREKIPGDKPRKLAADGRKPRLGLKKEMMKLSA